MVNEVAPPHHADVVTRLKAAGSATVKQATPVKGHGHHDTGFDVLYTVGHDKDEGRPEVQRRFDGEAPQRHRSPVE